MDWIQSLGHQEVIYREEIQRITIARAMLKDAPIILLDEATAFSDAENEYKIQQALSSMIKNKTVIMIAHRLSTITHADQILVMKEGELVEKGQHKSLITQNGVYANMYNDYQQSINWKLGVKNEYTNIVFIIKARKRDLFKTTLLTILHQLSVILPVVLFIMLTDEMLKVYI